MNNELNTKSLFISIVGRPNVGKSSLMNMIINSKVSIVSPKPQTTRNKIRGILTENNTQFVFSDTPGIHRPRTKLGDYMISEVNSSFSGAEACIHVVEAGCDVSELDMKLIKKFQKLSVPTILIINKIDLVKDRASIMKSIEEFSKLYDYHCIIPVSAKLADGKKEILDEIHKLAKPSVFFYDADDITDQTERVLVSEIIREKMLKFLDKELPHGIAISIERFRERDADDVTEIDAVIYCERENHKGIIIGKGGNMLKKIGSVSRVELEDILDRKINLKLWVKVKENWRNKNFLLSDLGYNSKQTG